MVGDWPESVELVIDRAYSDLEDDIFKIEQEWPEPHSPVRKVNQLVVNLGEAKGIKTYIVAPPLICKPSSHRGSRHWMKPHYRASC